MILGQYFIIDCRSISCTLMLSFFSVNSNVFPSQSNCKYVKPIKMNLISPMKEKKVKPTIFRLIKHNNQRSIKILKQEVNITHKHTSRPKRKNRYSTRCTSRASKTIIRKVCTIIVIRVAKSFNALGNVFTNKQPPQELLREWNAKLNKAEAIEVKQIGAFNDNGM